MTQPVEQTAESIHVRRVAGLINQAKTEPVANKTFRAAISHVLYDLPTIADEHGTQAHNQAVLVAQYAQAIIGSRYMHAVFPEIATLTYLDHGPDGDADVTLDIAVFDADGDELDMTDPQKELAVTFVIEQITGGVPEFIPTRGESITLDLAALYADHRQPDDEPDEILGLNDIPTDVTVDDVEAATLDRESAIQLILGASNGKHINPIPDDVIRCAHDEVTRRYKATGLPAHINFGIWLNGLLMSRALHAQHPEIAVVEGALTQNEDGKTIFITEFHDQTGEPIEYDSAVSAEILQLVVSHLLPNATYNQYVWDAGIPLRIEIDEMIKSVPGTPAGL